MPGEAATLDDDEAPDVVDVQPQEFAHKANPAFPWVVLVIGVVMSAVLMAAITVSTVPLSLFTVPASVQHH